MLREAVTVLESPADADTVHALGELAALEIFSGQPDAEQLVTDALSMAQALDVPASALTQLFIVRGIGHSFANRIPESAAYLREALRRAEAAQDSGAAARALLNLADALVTDDPHAAAEAARSGIAHCRRIGNGSLMAVTVLNLMQALLLTGDWSGAEQAHAVALDKDGLVENPIITYSVVLLHAFRGDRAGVAAAMPLMDSRSESEDPQDIAIAETVRAAGAACHVDPTTTLGHARTALEHAETIGLRNDAIRWSWVLGADAALALDDDREVSRLLEWLSAYPPGHIPPVLKAEMLRIRAKQLRARGEDSADAFDAATRAFRDLGSPYHLAVGLLDHADERSACGAMEEAHRLASEAAVIASSLAATPLTERAAVITGAAPSLAAPAEV